MTAAFRVRTAKIIGAVIDDRVDVGVLPRVPEDGRFFRSVCMSQDIVALVPVEHKMAKVKTVDLHNLIDERLIFQKRGSATQRVVDAAFKKSGLKPRPALVLETGSEVYEAVVNGLGIGFMWRNGTSRKDGTRRLSVRQLNTKFEEVIFRRANLNNPIVNLFFITTAEA
ncbi:MAG: hypothetical protein CMM59_11445 [Rhodospirillaceae bacterium]|nr:hypothetical protein [Rhodospirillaceae bacterium]